MSPTPGRPRVILDCSTVIQAIANQAGPAGQVFQLFQTRQIELCASRATLRELRAVLRYPAVRDLLPWRDDQHLDSFLTHFAFHATLIRRVPHVFDYPRAVQDEPYVDLAAAAGADYLISRDKDLLSLATDRSLLAKQFRRRFPRLRILDPVAFLATRERGRSP